MTEHETNTDEHDADTDEQKDAFDLAEEMNELRKKTDGEITAHHHGVHDFYSEEHNDYVEKHVVEVRCPTMEDCRDVGKVTHLLNNYDADEIADAVGELLEYEVTASTVGGDITTRTVTATSKGEAEAKVLNQEDVDGVKNECTIAFDPAKDGGRVS